MQHSEPNRSRSYPIDLPDVPTDAPTFDGTEVPVEYLFTYWDKRFTLKSFLMDFPEVSSSQALAALRKRSESEILADSKEVLTLEDEVMRELHEIRANIVSEHGHDSQKLDAFFESLRYPGFTYGIPGRTFQTEEELDEYIEERDREFERRMAEKDASDDMRPPEKH